MSTNYYLQAQDPCPHCKREYETLHIGKSSAGWMFALRIYPELNIMELVDWEREWENKVIVDEYGSVISKEQILNTITKRPKTLMRHGKRGKGTYDLMSHEFC